MLHNHKYTKKYKTSYCCSIFFTNKKKEKTLKWFLLFILCRFFLEFFVTRCSWERNHVADISHTCYEQQQSFEAKAETCMRT